MKKLTKSSIIDLKKDGDDLKNIRVQLDWETPENSPYGSFDLDGSVFGLVKSEIESGYELFDEDYFIYYKHTETENKSIVHSGDDKTGETGESIVIKLDLIPIPISHISFFVTIHRAIKKMQNFGMVKNSVIRLWNEDNGELIAEYKLNESFSDETAVHFGTIYRGAEGWEFKAIGQGYKRDLADILYSYGVEV
jgi:tellurium resistance protein TerD